MSLVLLTRHTPVCTPYDISVARCQGSNRSKSRILFTTQLISFGSIRCRLGSFNIGWTSTTTFQILTTHSRSEASNLRILFTTQPLSFGSTRCRLGSFNICWTSTILGEHSCHVHVCKQRTCSPLLSIKQATSKLSKCHEACVQSGHDYVRTWEVIHRDWRTLQREVSTSFT